MSYCGPCKRSFVHDSALQAHLSFSPRHNFFCKVCRSASRSIKGLQKHLDDVHEYCVPCKRYFVNDTALQAHIAANPKHSTTCNVCALLLPITELQQHKEEIHHFCEDCCRYFVGASALEAHLSTSSRHNMVCEVCSQLVPIAELQEHQDESHRFCTTCNRFFVDFTALKSHLADSPAHRCDICGSPVGDSSLQEHKSTNHGFCAPCDRWFLTIEGLSNHRNTSSKHVDEFRCLACDKPFPSLYALDKHLHTQHSQSPAEPQTVLEVAAVKGRCATCELDFHNDEAYRKHLASLRHNPICRPLSCVFCERTFSAPSSLAMHLESGSCGDMTKTSVDSAVAAVDTMGVVTTLRSGGGRIVDSCSSSESGAEEQEEEEAGMLTPLSADGGVVLPEYWLCCPLCPRDRGPFINERALQQHLCSPVHAKKIYHCPVKLGGGNPELSFKTLSGLLQHLEAGVCKGGEKTLKKAVGWLEALRGIGFGGVRLLGRS